VGSGSYGHVLGFASNRDISLSMIHMPEISTDAELSEGYMGHDQINIEHDRLIRTFPVYESHDAHAQPTGGTQKVTYGLYPGEAMWQLVVEKSEILP
jgi:hypothetical protein